MYCYDISLYQKKKKDQLFNSTLYIMYKKILIESHKFNTHHIIIINKNMSVKTALDGHYVQHTICI